MCGTPFFADTAPVLSVFGALGLFTSPLNGYMFCLVMQLFCSGIFMFYYLNKGLKVGTNSSLLAAVIFMFSPMFLVNLPNYCSEPAGLLWLPLVLLFYECLLESKDIIYAVYAALTLALSLYSGIGYFYIYTCVFVFLYGILRISKISGSAKEMRRNFYLLAGILLVSFLLSSARIIPTLEASSLSHRGGEYLKEGLVVSDLIGIFLPLGPIRIGNVEIGTLRNISLYYVGTATIPLLIAAIFCIKKDNFIRLFSILGLGLVVFLLALYYTPIKLYLSKISSILSTLGLRRFYFFYPFIAASLAALGYEKIQMSKVADRARLSIRRFINFFITGYMITFILFIILWVGKDIFKVHIFSGILPAVFGRLFSSGGYVHNMDFYISKFSYIYDQVFLYPFAALLCLILISRIGSLLFLSRAFKNIKKFSLLFVFFVFADFFTLNMLFTNPFSYDYYKVYESNSPETAFLKTINPLERVGIKINYYSMDYSGDNFKLTPYDKQIADLGPYNLGLNYNIPTAFGASLAGGMDPLYSKKMKEFIDLAHRGDLNYPVRYQMRKSQHVIEFTSIDSPLVDLMGVKYLFSVSILNNPKLKLLFKGRDYYVYENLKVSPRGFFVKNTKVALTKEELFGMLSRPQFDPLKEVILSEPLAGETGNLKKDNLGGSHSVKISYYGPDKVEISAASNEDNFLILTDADYPGWKAFIDGKATKIYAADYLFRGIYFPKGRHRIEFIYAPFSFEIGAWISSVTLFCLGLFLVVIRLSRKRKVRHAAYGY